MNGATEKTRRAVAGVKRIEETAKGGKKYQKRTIKKKRAVTPEEGQEEKKGSRGETVGVQRQYQIMGATS